MVPTKGTDKPNVVQFTVNGHQYKMSITQFAQFMGLYDVGYV